VSLYILSSSSSSSHAAVVMQLRTVPTVLLASTLLLLLCCGHVVRGHVIRANVTDDVERGEKVGNYISSKIVPFEKMVFHDVQT